TEEELFYQHLGDSATTALNILQVTISAEETQFPHFFNFFEKYLNTFIPSILQRTQWSARQWPSTVCVMKIENFVAVGFAKRHWRNQAVFQTIMKARLQDLRKAIAYIKLFQSVEPER